MIDKFSPLVIKGKVCSYCYNKSELVDSAVIYGNDAPFYGMMYYCRRCNAWVGTHLNSEKALGRLADRELRGYKKEAHKYFDNLWRRKMHNSKCTKSHARTRAYAWLGKKLGLPKKHTHIGMFDVNLCKKVIELCKGYYFY